MAYGNWLCGLRLDGSADCADCQKWSDWQCKPALSSPLAAGPFRKIGMGPNCICGLTNDGVLRCWPPLADAEACQIPAGDGGKVLDFWRGCVMNAAGVIYCDTPSRTIDLDHP
jgi:hypothetical protein